MAVMVKMVTPVHVLPQLKTKTSTSSCSLSGSSGSLSISSRINCAFLIPTVSLSTDSSLLCVVVIYSSCDGTESPGDRVSLVWPGGPPRAL